MGILKQIQARNYTQASCLQASSALGSRVSRIGSLQLGGAVTAVILLQFFKGKKYICKYYLKGRNIYVSITL